VEGKIRKGGDQNLGEFEVVEAFLIFSSQALSREWEMEFIKRLLLTN
jgi:hypothetical protein